ncbi:MAG: hypothetical protein AABY83_15320 [Pseudomonadota bacterium]
MSTLAAFQPGRLFYAGSVGRETRFVTEFGYASGWRASQNDLVGGRVSNMTMSTSLQWRFVFASQLKPWVGAGLGYQTNHVIERHRTDAQGFLVQRYDDIKAGGVVATLRTGTFWNLSRYGRWGLEWRTDYPFAANVARIDGLGFVFLYAF